MMTPPSIFPLPPLKRLLLAVIAPLWLLAGCAETELAVHTAKQLGRSPGGADGGGYKVGRPYKISNVWYYPKIDYAYREEGIASWYGPGFHGRSTANGERFDQNAMTAAHRTLPLPSVVRVTNLENGRSVKVRVNDRGPFAHGRIIDLSRAAAESLAFRQQGTARVLVEIVEHESRAFAGDVMTAEAAEDAPDAVPIAAVAEVPLAPPTAGRPIPVAASLQGQGSPMRVTPDAAAVRSRIVALPSRGSARAITRPVAALPVAQPVAATMPLAAVDAAGSGLFVQAGAFTDPYRARQLQEELAAVGAVSVAPVVVDGQRFFRVRVGPMPSPEAADQVLAHLVTNGMGQARLIWQ